MHTVAQPAPRPVTEQITELLKEINIIERSGDVREPGPSPSAREDRRQQIRRELVQLVSRLGWRQGLPLRMWQRARCGGRLQGATIS
jgi:hypothetical protein